MTKTYSGYKKGELKHAGLSKSRLEELSTLHPELAEEIKEILKKWNIAVVVVLVNL